VPVPPDVPLPPAEPQAVIPSVAPSSFGGNASGPSVAAAKYNPRTGEYLGTDGKWHRQSNLVTSASQSWKDLLPQA
jgi:phospholipid/cholesterol/gamma-HCH transport system substrate-binding protein